MNIEERNQLFDKYFPSTCTPVKLIKKNFRDLDHNLKDIYDSVGFDKLSKETYKAEDNSGNQRSVLSIEKDKIWTQFLARAEAAIVDNDSKAAK